MENLKTKKTKNIKLSLDGYYKTMLGWSLLNGLDILDLQSSEIDQFHKDAYPDKKIIGGKMTKKHMYLYYNE